MSTSEYEIEDAETIVIVEDEAAFAALPAFDAYSRDFVRRGSNMSAGRWTLSRMGQASRNLQTAFGLTGRISSTDYPGSYSIKKWMTLEALGNPRDGPRIVVVILIMEWKVILGYA
jgi:hypothetical protein